jgi:protease-4
MGKLALLGRIITSWYVAGPALAVVGILFGYLLFFNVLPGKPKIGVVDIPFTGISEDAASVITAYLEYCRQDPSIKGVVIKLSSPGGGASASEQLYIETRRLREEKPVVVVMNGLVASGGFMMAMGASHTYVKTSSLVGNIGVVAGTGGVLSPQFPETIVFTGPYKLTGTSRRNWFLAMDWLKEAFIAMVVEERGDKLKISPEALADGRLYSGMEAVRLGLADEIGSDSHAYAKAAELAGISNYDLLNVNVEVNRLFIQDLRRIYSSSGDVETPLTEADTQLLTILANRQSPQRQVSDDLFPDGLSGVPELDASDSQESWLAEGANGTVGAPVDLEAIKLPLEYGILGAPANAAFPDFPMEIKQPKFYYLYVGAGP